MKRSSSEFTYFCLLYHPERAVLFPLAISLCKNVTASSGAATHLWCRSLVVRALTQEAGYLHLCAKDTQEWHFSSSLFYICILGWEVTVTEPFYANLSEMCFSHFHTTDKLQVPEASVRYFSPWFLWCIRDWVWGHSPLAFTPNREEYTKFEVSVRLVGWCLSVFCFSTWILEVLNRVLVVC